MQWHRYKNVNQSVWTAFVEGLFKTDHRKTRTRLLIGLYFAPRTIYDRELTKAERLERHHNQMIEENPGLRHYFTGYRRNILTWNKGAEAIKGYTEEEVLGKNFRIFIYLKTGSPAFRSNCLKWQSAKVVHDIQEDVL
jgi:PAS domain-containing protein